MAEAELARPRRRLMVLRHGHAARADGDDHARPLSPFGWDEARAMGAQIARLGAPGLVLCSSARRALETLEAVCEASGAAQTVRVERSLYLAGRERMLDEILGLPDEEVSVLFVGHNPGAGQLVRSLARGGSESALARLARGFPTGCLAVLALEAARWRDAHRGALLEHLAAPGAR
jgi:phosphohistidine phosphatase